MDVFGGVFGWLDELWGQFLALLTLLFAPVFIFLGRIFSITRLAGMLTSTGSRIGGAILEGRVVRRLTENRKLPPLIVPQTWKQFVGQAADFAYRLQYYSDTIQSARAGLTGEYALSYQLALDFQPRYREWLARFEADLARFDALEEDWRDMFDRFKAELDARNAETLAALIDQEALMLRMKAERRALLPEGRGVWPFCRRLASRFTPEFMRATWTLWKAASTANDLLNQLKQEEDLVFREHQTEIAEKSARLVQFDEKHLHHNVHVMAADTEALRLTVHSGRLLSLATGTSERAGEIRDGWNLGAILGREPAGPASARGHLAADLAKGETAAAPLAGPDALLEMALRQHLMAMAVKPGAAPLAPKADPDWIRALALPPGISCRPDVAGQHGSASPARAEPPQPPWRGRIGRPASTVAAKPRDAATDEPASNAQAKSHLAQPSQADATAEPAQSRGRTPRPRPTTSNAPSAKRTSAAEPAASNRGKPAETRKSKRSGTRRSTTRASRKSAKAVTAPDHKDKT